MFRLAWRYICFHRIKSILLVGCIAITVALPIAFQILLWQFDRQIVARADETPLVLGARGSRLDLTLAALYLQDKELDPITYGDCQRLQNSGYAQSIPLHLGYTAQRFSVVGSSLEYFEFRGLELSSGHTFHRLGDCVVGSEVARLLQLRVGDELKSDRTNSLDIASNPPLYMRVVGILQPSRTADDQGVFVDLKTSWVLDGLGHGHQDLQNIDDETLVLDRDENTTIASAAVTSVLRITEDNIRSFHFHGEPEEFPITAVIAVPDSVRSRDLLFGEYLPGSNLQLVEPANVVRDLMQLVFRAKQFFDANALAIALATFLLLCMVLALSLKLREREMQTMFKIGCSQMTIFRLQSAELLLIVAASSILVASLIAVVLFAGAGIVQSLLLTG